MEQKRRDFHSQAIRRCERCSSREKVEGSGYVTCSNCGQVVDVLLSNYVSYEHNKDDYLKQRSEHCRVRWFKRLMRNHIHSSHWNLISHEFQEIVRCMESLRLLEGRNLVKYSFYLIRLCSRNGVELRTPLPNLKTKKALNTLEDRLFGKVYVELGWSGTGCEYYERWKLRRNTPVKKPGEKVKTIGRKK